MHIRPKTIEARYNLAPKYARNHMSTNQYYCYCGREVCAAKGPRTCSRPCAFQNNRTKFRRIKNSLPNPWQPGDRANHTTIATSRRCATIWAPRVYPGSHNVYCRYPGLRGKRFPKPFEISEIDHKQTAHRQTERQIK